MGIKNTRLPLAEALDAFAENKPSYFCTPGHRFEQGVPSGLSGRFGKDVFKYDLTETYTLDDLYRPKGAIKKAQDMAAKLFGARHSRFLVNGTTCGIQAMMTACVSNGDKILISRNAHYSCVSGLVISGASPVWMLPHSDEARGIFTCVSPETVRENLEKHKDIKAVTIVSPTYYGDISRIREISDLCHEKGIPLLVDEAHGAHLYFSERAHDGAIKNGADAASMSIHKTLGSLTQSSMLHLKSDLMDIGDIDSALRLLMSSSPSYLLMASLDAARAQMQECGRELYGRAAYLGNLLSEKIKKIDGAEVYEGDCSGYKDPTRVVFSFNKIGISGIDISDKLYHDYNICIETADRINAVAIVTFGNDISDIEKLENALKSIAFSRNRTEMYDDLSYKTITDLPLPVMRYTPREAYFAEHELIRLESAAGRIAAESISPYPPGIPIICPGEIITHEIYEILRFCQKNLIPVHASGTHENEKILVLKQ